MKKTKSLLQWCIEKNDMNLVEQWDKEKNSLTVEEIGFGVGKEFWWKCKNGHSWQASPNRRTNGRKNTDCPYCAKRKPSREYNFKTVYPEVAKLWYEGNKKKPEEILPKSKLRAKWICSRGHITTLAVCDKVNHPGCSKCQKEDNNLETNYPEVIKEWHPYYNYPNLPKDYSYASPDNVWWRCSKNIHHNWSARISNRTLNNRGCPFCQSERSTSFYEQSIFFYVKKAFEETQNRYVVKDVGEVDIFIPSKNICIEYNSYYRHKHRLKEDALKYKKLLKGNKVICIQDYKNSVEGVIGICFDKNTYANLEAAIKKLLLLIDISNNINVNIKQDEIKILNQYKKNVVDNNFASRYPEIAKQWHPRLNLNLLPEMFLETEIKGFWWQCEKDEEHVWNTSIYNRTKHKSKCPFCKGLKATKEHNILTRFPEVEKMWHPTLNKIKASEVLPYSENKAYFIQEDGSVKFEKICNVTSRVIARRKRENSKKIL